MNTSSIISLARDQAHTSNTIVTDNEAIVLLNQIYHDAVYTIKNDIWEDFLYQEWEIDSEVDVSKYPFDQAIPTEDYIDKIQGVLIKYTADQAFYTPARHVLATSLEKEEAFYEQYQPTNDPIFYVQNDVLKIFPAPKESIIDGIVLKSLMGVKDLELSTAEDSIRVPRTFHTVLVHGLMWLFFQRRGLTNDEKYYRWEYKQAKRDMVRDLSDKVKWPIHVVMPNLSQF